MLGSVPYPSLGVAPLVWATPTLPLLQVTSTYLLYLSIVSTNISTNLTNLSTNLHSIYTSISPYPQAGPLLSPGWCLQSLLLQSQANLLAHTLMQGHGE